MEIVKRSGEIVSFDSNKILNAIQKALTSTNESTNIIKDSEKLCQDVLVSLENFERLTVEEIQDKVENSLMKNHFYKTAKCYILYRDEHNKKRLLIIDKKVAEVFKESATYFDNDTMRECVFLRTYSRWLKNENRRESWVETVQRYMDFMKENLGDKLTISEYTEIELAIKRQEVMPSMRLLQFSGVAARRCNATVYNCSYTAPECFKDLADITYLLMSGCGVGFSVELIHVEKFPVIKHQKVPPVICPYVIEDSKEAWCDAFLFGLKTWFDGEDVNFDYSRLRPCGAPLKIMGGRSSGPQPLIDLMEFTRTTILKSVGMKLTTLQMYDIICKIGQIVVSGGIRRCIAKGSKVLVKDESYKNIEDIKIGDLVLTNNGWKPVVNFFNQGSQKTINIYHQEGKITCTPNHRIAVFNNDEFIWKEAGNLEMKDFLGFPMRDEKGETYDGEEYDGRIKLIQIKKITENDDLQETYDIEVQDNHNFVCEGILVHNSAMISLSDLHDTEIREAKSGMFWNNNPQRSMANNSAAYNIKPSMTQFMKEWLSLAESGTGERGIFNRAGLEKILPERRVEKIGQDMVKNLGCNPCVTADTWVQTVDGPEQVADLIYTKKSLIINGKEYAVESDGFFFTGKKPVYKVKTEKGFSLKLTKDHFLLVNKKGYLMWQKLSDISVGTSIMLSNHRGIKKWIGTGGTFTEGLNSFESNVEKKSYDFYCGYLKQKFICKQWQNLEYSCLNVEILEMIQRMLSRLGIGSEIKDDKIQIDNIDIFSNIIFEYPYGWKSVV